MKAVVIQEPRRTGLLSIDPPQPGPGEVLLRVRRVGLCGSDLNTFRGLNPLVRYPRIPGHEIAATIEALGAGVPATWRAGQTVTLNPYTACGACSSCRAGRANACRENQTLGVQRDGALSEFACVPHGKLLAHAGLGLDELALVEPFSVGFHAAARGRVAAGETVLVLGCGTIGLGAIAACALRGARVLAVDLDPRKRALAAELGAAEGFDAGAGLEAAVRERTGGHGPAAVIEAVGAPQTYRQAVELAAFAGRVVYIGYAKAEVAYETKHFVAKELDILGSRNALGEFDEVLAAFAARRFDPLKLVTHRVSLDEAGDALRDWANDPNPVTKILVEVGA
ncbi:MAG: zinc-binding alcohol dehydrogenase family protein [Planctomycetota bacterium]|nr:zinc-binding alcohol dehydrogenase family protein [Planctomycetota bacterium]